MSDTLTPLTDDQVAAIRARLEARTPGQWLHATAAPFGFIAKCGDSADATEYVTPQDLNWLANGAHHDAAFIAHAPDDIRALLADRTALTRRVEDLTAAFTQEDVKLLRFIADDEWNGAEMETGAQLLDIADRIARILSARPSFEI